MPSISNGSKNNKTVSNADMNNSATVDDMATPYDDAQLPYDDPGNPLSKQSKNNKSLSNASENT